MSLITLQKQSGVTPDGKMGPNTFNAAAKHLGIQTREGAIHFFAQCEHETGGFKHFEENLNYSADGLREVWPKRFTAQSSLDYARQPVLIANKVYANRMGNGDEASGDGYLFRGRGALQLTGRFNYQKFSVYVDDPSILKDPSPVSDKYAFKSAMFFFRVNKLWRICELGVNEDVVKQLTKAINGRYNGLEDRLELTKKYTSYRWDA